MDILVSNPTNDCFSNLPNGLIRNIFSNYDMDIFGIGGLKIARFW